MRRSRAKKRETIKRKRGKKEKGEKVVRWHAPLIPAASDAQEVKKEEKNNNTIATKNNNKRSKYCCIEKKKVKSWLPNCRLV